MVLMPTSTVAELVNEARRGSAEARDELVRRHHREAAILAAAMVDDPTEAEDLSQEAFIRAFRNLDLLVDPSRFGAWLRRIVIGVSIDWLRSFRPDLYRGWTDADEMVNASRDRSPLDHLLHSEMVQRVGAALDALPPRYRVPIRLYHLDGLSHAKIAAGLGVPVATVRSLVARARRKLAPLLTEYAPEAVLQTPEVFEEQVVPHSSLTRFLHVANGTCTTRIIESAGIPGTLSIWADPLYEGPVPGGLTDAELLDVRTRHLAGSTDEALIADPVNDMRRWRTVIERHESYDELILWFEHDLFDQLSLIQLLAWIRERLPAAKVVSLVCIGSFPGHPRFKGLGELTPDELASLLETRQHVSDAQYSLAELAWQAFREPTPEALDNLRLGDTAALPYLAAAVARFLQEYPWTTDGLSRTERRLLELAAGGKVELSAAFPRMHADEEVYYVTDMSLATLADTLSRTSPPLLTLAQRTVADGELPRGSVTLRDAVTLTDIGRAVLARRQDRIATCGIDRWLGGVHLQGDADLWRWDDERQRITRR
jgi:RNA polymerase sigma factor (sigma-70 family)